MYENIAKKDDTGVDNTPKGILAWFKNFWYHYKWHSIVALFLIFTITICSVQMCQKESYDIYILYAGSHEIERTNKNGDIAEYATLTSSLKRVTQDYDEDGNTVVSFKDLFMLSSEEIKEIEKSDEKIEINRSLLIENQTILNETMMYSNYYVCLLSKSVYNEYRTVDDVEMFSSLSSYVDADTNVEYYTESAIYLNSTAFYLLPGICNLPADTLICLRNTSAIANHFDEKGTKEAHRRSVDTISKILNYKA